MTYSGSQVIYHMVAGSSIHLPDTFTFVRTGYTMDGWVDKPNGDKVIAPGSRYWMPGGSVVLYAHWVPNSYIIRFQPGAVDVLGYEDMVDVRVNYDTHAYLPSNTMTREGYRFVGWTSDYGSFSNCGEVYNLTTVNDKVITLTAVWQALPHTVTFNGGEGGHPFRCCEPADGQPWRPCHYAKRISPRLRVDRLELLHGDQRRPDPHRHD